MNLFDGPLNHQTQVTSGVLADKAADLLQRFFAQRRNEQHKNKTPLKDDALRSDDATLVSAWSRHAQDWPSLQGWRLHWLDNGIEGPAILYLSDADHWSAAYIPSLEQAAKNHQHAIALDWLGLGLSDKPKKETAYSGALHARVLMDFLRHHDVHEIRATLATQPSVASILRAVPTAIPPVVWIEPPVMNAALANAPYPDRGHEAGRRAWRTI
jgi:hypothetical protein